MYRAPWALRLCRWMRELRPPDHLGNFAFIDADSLAGAGTISVVITSTSGNFDPFEQPAATALQFSDYSNNNIVFRPGAPSDGIFRSDVGRSEGLRHAQIRSLHPLCRRQPHGRRGRSRAGSERCDGRVRRLRSVRTDKTGTEPSSSSMTERRSRGSIASPAGSDSLPTRRARYRHSIGTTRLEAAARQRSRLSSSRRRPRSETCRLRRNPRSSSPSETMLSAP